MNECNPGVTKIVTELRCPMFKTNHFGHPTSGRDTRQRHSLLYFRQLVSSTSYMSHLICTRIIHPSYSPGTEL
jgi:hypothetical protein